jgi:aminopeptidase N
VLAASAVVSATVGAIGAGPSFGAASPDTGAARDVIGNVDVTDYDITMNYQPDTRTLRGVTVVHATATAALDGLTLDLTGPTVRSVTVNSAPAKSFTQTGKDVLAIVPATAIARGARFDVRVNYDGTPGAGWLATASGGASAFEGHASAWFPANEDAHDKADLHLTATVPDGWSVVSIGQEGPIQHDSTTTTFRWAEPDVDPAFTAVSIDHFTIEHSTLPDGIPVVNAYAPGLGATTKPLADQLPEILGFLSGKFGPYPSTRPATCSSTWTTTGREPHRRPGRCTSAPATPGT